MKISRDRKCERSATWRRATETGKRKIMRTILMAILTSMVATAGVAQEYPTKPVRIVHGYAAGGATDNVARILGEELRKELGQPIVVESRPGASGTIAATAIARSAPNGYSLLLGTVGSQTINVQIINPPPYDPVKDFAPISLAVINDGVLVANKSFPANNFKEFVELLKKSPGTYMFASSGTGGPTHLGGELLKSTAKIEMTHVPYRGDGPAMTDVMGGSVPLLVTVMASAAPFIKADSVKALAALGDQRFPEFPDLPTVAEQGYPGFSAYAWIALFAPAGTSPAIVEKLNKATRKALAQPDVVKKLNALGSRVKDSTPEELTELVKADFKKWGDIIRENKITAE
jgi:tripartite-type tricarboxylate transporter receptor subunit TctC